MILRPGRRLVRFGAFDFDLSSGDLWKAGRRIKLQNQPRQVLRMLVSRRGELVTREELHRELWPDDTFVDFNNGLNVAIRKIREALGDVAPSSRFIETERARGYRFIAAVSEESLPDDARARAIRASVARWTTVPVVLTIAIALFGVAAAVVSRVVRPAIIRVGQEPSSPISLAVLPFSVADGGIDDALAVGIPDGIITRLSNVKHFRVRPTSAVARYRGGDIDAQDIGRRLGSQYVLVGSIRPIGDRVRVSAQLVRTTDGASVWARQFEQRRGEVLGVEDALAGEIAGALQAQMSAAERERFYRRYTRSGAAYERYLMGRARLRSITEEDALRAIEEFEAARKHDPKYALAYAGLATAAAQLRVRFGSPQKNREWDDRARREAGHALELDPDLAEAHLALAAVHRFQEYDWDTVIQESRRALELNPSLDIAHLYLAAAYFHIGLLDQAETEVQLARELNPENRLEPFEILGAINLFAGRTDDAARHLSEAHHQSDSRIVRYLFGWTLYYLDERARAEALLQTMIDDEGPLPGNARATLAAIHASRGAHAEARALAARVATEPDLLHHAAYGLGAAYAQLRDPATALRWLSQAATTGFSCYPWYERDPLLNPIRDDARFTAFMRDLHRSWQDAQAKYAK
jgi:TolB-like protein/DNA-binding winged helix-turn-helix (wHTH) protein/Tfp pilus assembly protein PilF